MLLFIITTTSTSSGYARFNTSHVTLYPMLIVGCNTIIGFQYISCYSLSVLRPRHWYCLRCFNTSHVTLYRLSASHEQIPMSVSIHLMLLFIPRFIGFSSSNSFYNTAKYKGLQDFYQPTSHFLFTHQNLGITPVFSIFFIFL